MTTEPRTKLTPATLKRLWKRHAGGETLTALATEVGVHTGTLEAYWARLGLERVEMAMPGDVARGKTRDWYVEQLAAGRTLTEIARELQTPYSAVRNQVAVYGLQPQRVRKLRGGVANVNVEQLRHDLIVEGMTTREAAEVHGVSRGGIRLLAKEHAIPLAAPGRGKGSDPGGQIPPAARTPISIELLRHYRKQGYTIEEIRELTGGTPAQLRPLIRLADDEIASIADH